LTIQGRCEVEVDGVSRGDTPSVVEAVGRVSTSFLHGSSPRPPHPGATLEVSRNNGQISEEFTMMGSYGNGMGSLGWLGMGVFWLLLLGLIAWLVMRLLPGSTDQTSRPNGDSAADILDRRMARGEIDVSEWQTQRTALQSTQDSRR
jgi:putative membrane protein